MKFKNKLTFIRYVLTALVPDVDRFGVHYPKDTLPGFGLGFLDWAKYYIGGYPGAAQYMSPRRLTGYSHIADRTHFNLCGPIAVAAALCERYGIDIEETFQIFTTLPGGPEILNNNKATNGYTLAGLIEAVFIIASEGEIRTDIPRNSTALDTFEELSAALDQGDVLIPLVNIDGGGRLRPIHEPERDIAHWVWLREVFTYAGRTFVEVYNPFMNRFEVYSLETFLAAYEITPGNSSRSLAVRARIGP